MLIVYFLRPYLRLPCTYHVWQVRLVFERLDADGLISQRPSDVPLGTIVDEVRLVDRTAPDGGFQEWKDYHWAQRILEKRAELNNGADPRSSLSGPSSPSSPSSPCSPSPSTRLLASSPSAEPFAYKPLQEEATEAGLEAKRLPAPGSVVSSARRQQHARGAKKIPHQLLTQKPSPALPCHARLGQAKPSQAKPSLAEPGRTRPSIGKANQRAKPSQLTQAEATELSV